MEVLMAFFGTGAGQVTAAAASSLLIWILGKGVRLPVAKGFFDNLARLGGKAGDFVDALGKRKLGAAISNPLEDIFYQAVGRPIEEFFAHLRKDNVEKLTKHLEDLQAVGSETRAKAIAEKLQILAATPDIQAGPTNAEVLAQAVAAGEAATKSRLEGSI